MTEARARFPGILGAEKANSGATFQCVSRTVTARKPAILATQGVWQASARFTVLAAPRPVC